jgi:uncharacterized protein (DUF1800 family)
MHRRYLFDEKAVGDLRLAQAIRATRSRRHLLEVVVDLWHDRFAASMAKAAVDQHLPTYDRQAIRPYALGRFADLLRAVTLSGAMLEYLDGARSTAERPNENHARELLELHTVGRDAGFTQADVVGASKVLSGWTLDSRLNVVFDGSRHDGGPATVLGWSTPGHPGPGGNVDVFSMLDHLAAHPATARRVADLFARRFVADDPPAGVVDAGTDAFLRTGGDLAATLRAVLATDAFRSGTPMFRRGFDALAAMMRAAGTTVDNGTGLLRLLRARHDARAALYWLEGQLGQVTFRAPNPAGHRLRGSSWLSGDSLLTRWQTAAYIAAGQLPGLPTDARALSGGAATAGGAVDAIARQCFAQPPAPATRAAALRAMAQGENEAPSDDTCRGALAFLLAAPELQVR